jgi:hypothetical protein
MKQVLVVVLGAMTFGLCGCASERLTNVAVGRLIDVRGGIYKPSEDQGPEAILVIHTTIGTYFIVTSTAMTAEETLAQWLAAMDDIKANKIPTGTTPRLVMMTVFDCVNRWKRIPYNRSGLIAFNFRVGAQSPSIPLGPPNPSRVYGNFGSSLLKEQHFHQTFFRTLDIPFDYCEKDQIVGGNGSETSPSGWW